MSIRDYIQNQVFARRAKDHGCLVIYDPERRYREIALAMEAEKRRIVDASESIITQREVASEALAQLASGTIHHLIIWVPANAPKDDEEKQKDPFSVFAALGTRFPDPDATGDEFAELCRRAKQDHIPEVNRLFDAGVPTFEMIDALDDGGSWPRLKSLLFVNSPKEILLGILSPGSASEEKLKNDATWVTEAREFSQRNLGHRLKTKGHTRQAIAEELWRLLLFSE